jgi:hypothetical protein
MVIIRRVASNLNQSINIYLRTSNILTDLIITSRVRAFLHTLEEDSTGKTRGRWRRHTAELVVKAGEEATAISKDLKRGKTSNARVCVWGGGWIWNSTVRVELNRGQF